MDQDTRGDDARLASAGDADALQRLIVRCHEPLHRAVVQAQTAALAGRLDPDDILQQAYIVAFRTLCSQNAEDALAPPDADDRNATAHADDRSAPAALGGVNPETGTAGNASPQSTDADDTSVESTAADHPTRPTFENTGHAYKWLESVALNQLRDAERAIRRQKRDVAREVRLAASPSASYPGLAQQLRSPDATPSRELGKSEAVAAMMSSLARLPETQRDVIRWRFLEEVPFADIASRLGKTEDAIYMICHRGLKALRGFMGAITAGITRP
ncbi:MAG: sigma-70 family RNA polymerase sigma factor [Phycisphaerae bacterium]|nr:sigma-70 family RNA polymerase sigma factor [Phycisphaerae bacterium]